MFWLKGVSRLRIELKATFWFWLKGIIELGFWVDRAKVEFDIVIVFNFLSVFFT
jgi:hypothetical protein